MSIPSTILSTVLALSAATFSPADAAAGDDLSEFGLATQVGAQIWIENEPNYFRRGDRMNIRFSVSDDAYVAVVHVDSDGQMEFLYPGSPFDRDFVRAGRVYSLPVRGSFASNTVRSSAGIGYLYLIASPYPLDYSFFGGGLGSSWDWGNAGRYVHGDPFLAFEQITRLLIPRYPYAPYTYDYHGYYVEGLHRYPSYACSDRYFDTGWGWTPAFGSCSRIDYFLRDYPYYYDTRRFSGDRRVYLRQYDRLDPRHGFKENPDAPPARGFTPRGDLPDPRTVGGATPGAREVPRREPPAAQPPRSQNPPARGVPTREPAAPAPQRGTTPQPRREPAAAPAPGSGSSGAQPRRQPAPAESAPSRGTTDSTPASRPESRREPAADAGSSSTPADRNSTPARGTPVRGRP